MLTTILLTACLAATCSDGDSSSTLQPLPPEEVSARVQSLERAHPALVSRLVLGTSRGERPIEALRLRGAAADEEVPGLLVVANVSGPRSFESRLALWQAEELARRFAEDDPATVEFLSSTTLYLVPAPHPDGLATRFATPAGGGPGTGHGIDDDRDGRLGEDPPADIDGDGVISWMRVPDPTGTWRADDDDPRVTVEAEPAAGESGRWKLVREGRDLDGDGEASEDAPHDTLLDRHFPAGWEEHTAGSGLFPLDEPEARALAEFVLARKDLALVLVYGDHDNLVSSPKGVDAAAPRGKRVPPAGVIEDDALVLAELGERYRELTENKERSSAPTAGSFQSWVYEHRGLPCSSAILWEMPDAPPAPSEDGPDGELDETEETGESAESDTTDPPSNGASEPGDTSPAGADAPPSSTADDDSKSESKAEKLSGDAGRLAWIDAVDPTRFVPWSPFDHPELGPVEIGGVTLHAERDPPAEERDAIADVQLAFLLSLGELLPRVSISAFEATPLGADLWRLEATVRNDALFAVRSAAAKRSGTVRPPRVALELPAGSALVAGRAQQLAVGLTGSGGQAEFTWLVRTSDAQAISLLVDSDHAGDARARAEVVQ